MEERCWRCKERPADASSGVYSMQWMDELSFILPFLYFYSLANLSLTSSFICSSVHSFIHETDIRCLLHFFKPKIQKYMISSLCLKNWIQQESVQMFKTEISFLVFVGT